MHDLRTNLKYINISIIVSVPSFIGTKYCVNSYYIALVVKVPYSKVYVTTTRTTSYRFSLITMIR